MALSAECPAGLPADTHIPSRTQNLINRSSGPPAEIGAIQKQHISALRHRDINALEMFLHKINRRAAVILQDTSEFIGPFLPLAAVGRDQRMLAEHIHFIVVRIFGKSGDLFIQCLIVDNMVASNQSCQIKGLARRIRCKDMLACPVADHLGRNVGVSGIRQIRPDLITDHQAVISLKHIHCFFNFFSGPHPAAWIMR